MAKVIVKDLSAGTSPVAAGTAVTTGVGGFGTYEAITFVASLIGATGGTLDVYIQHSPDNVTWYDYAHFPQLAAAAGAVYYSLSPALNNVITTIGAPTATAATATPAIAAGACAGGHWFEWLRVVYVAGVSTSAGAVTSIKVLCTRENA